MKLYTTGSQIKHKFPGIESITQNYSQTYQDMFVLTMLNGKRNGTFLEIGARHPIELSNTYLLEKEFGWNGVSIDIDASYVSLFEKFRNNTFLVGDAITMDYPKILSVYASQIDYLQIDIDPSYQSFNALMNLPMNDYRFSVITFEHDFYRDSSGPYVRQASRTLFSKYGYVLIAGNISNESSFDAFEDWWVDPRIVDSKLIEMFKRDGELNMPGDEFLAA